MSVWMTAANLEYLVVLAGIAAALFGIAGAMAYVSIKAVLGA